MSLTFGISPWLLALCALGAAAFTYWSYRRTVPPLARGRKLLLGGLRFLALFLVLFLLFRPVLRRVLRTEEPPVLAVLIDDSRSLRLTTGDSLAPHAAVEAALRRLDVPEGGVTRRFAFGQTLRPLPEQPTAALDSLRFNAPRTDIATALAAVRERLQRENLRAVVLLSDGQYNTGRNPLYVAERLGVPVHTVVLGDTSRRRDVQVRRVTTNDLAYAGTAVPVQVGVRTEGFGGATVEVALTRNGERLDAQRIRLPEGAAEVPVNLQFTPHGAGLQRFIAGVSRLDGEATYRNNTQVFTVRVLESQRRVLLLAGAPSPDVGAFRQLLADLPNIELTTRIARGDGAFYEGSLPDSLASFDVLLLMGFPGPAAAPATVQEVVQAAEDDAALLFFLGAQTDLAALREHFAGVLPAVPEAVRPSYVEAQFVPAPRAFRHPLFASSDPAADWWRNLPPLSVNQSRWQVSPDADVLAHPEVRSVELEAPLLVTRSRSGQRTAALLGAGIWRWTNAPEDLATASRHWQTLFSDMLQWVSAPEMQRPVRVHPARETFAASEPVRLTGQVYDESLMPVAGASVEVVITGPDSAGTRTPHQMEALGNGRYGLTLGTLPEGTYRYRAEARSEDVLLGTDQGAFAVGPLTLEYKETRADAALLRQIALRSGGTFHTVEETGALPAQLARSAAFAPLVVEREREIPLWHRYGLLAAIIALLAAEWVLRKRSGMV